MTQCIGIGRILGHRYRPRESRTTYETNDEREYLRTTQRTYHGEMCERCGDRIERAADVRPVKEIGVRPHLRRAAS